MKLAIMIEQAHPIEGSELRVSDPEWFVFAMQKAFGSFPVTLDAGHLRTLEGMAAAVPMPNPYEAIVKHVKKYGSAKVWRQYAEEERSPESKVLSPELTDKELAAKMKEKDIL